MSRRVLVVGGGITGLAAAHALARAGVDVALLEASDRLGGKIRTEDLDGTAVDVGADAFLGRQPHARQLAAEVGLEARLRAPIASTVWLPIRGRRRQLPSGTVFGVPTDLLALARSRVLSGPALLRVATEPIRPRRGVIHDDAAVAEVVEERFGPEVVDRLVEPLLGGVYAGRADRLGVRATIPPLADAVAEPGSLLRGLAARRPASSDDPVFLTLQGGLQQLVDALAADVPDVSLGVEVRSVRASADGWAVATTAGDQSADAVVVTTPAPVTSKLLEEVSPIASRELAAIRYASVAVASFAFPTAATRRIPPGSGILVPRSEGRLVKAVTLSSQKWPHLASIDGRFLLRASVGRIDAPPPDVPDDHLIDLILGDLAELAGVAGTPETARVTRWSGSLPQYEVGHLDRVERIRTALRRDAPGVHVAGAAYDGVGVAHCVRQGQQVAASLAR